jgi:hypothetical protein
MKKVKLHFNFLSAADKMFSKIAVLFIPKVVTLAPVTTKVPHNPRR